MAEHTFTNWLQFEVHSARCALLRLYEEEERLKHIEGPRLEKAYMEAVGEYEESVVKEEMECELLTTKQRLVQAAINRREAVDEAAIDEKIDELRKDMIDAAAGDPSPQAYAELSSEQADELQELYSKIVKEFHPGMHPELTEAERQLYQKAQAAYRMRDLPALKLIWEMLTATDGEGMKMAFELAMGENAGEGDKVPSRDYSTDYSLASMLYASFLPLREEAAIVEEWKNYREKTNLMMEQIERMKQEFPYSAQEMLSDPQQIQAYKQELERRMRNARNEHEQLTQEIRKMIGGTRVRG